MSRVSKSRARRSSITGKHLYHSQKRRQWEYYTIKARADEVNNLLGQAALDEEVVAKLNKELDTLYKRGEELLRIQVKFLQNQRRR